MFYMRTAISKSVFGLFFLLTLDLGVNGQSHLSDLPKYLIPLIHRSHADTNRIALLNKLGGYYILKSGNFKYNLDSALTYLNQSLALSEKLHSIKWENETLKLKGDCYLKGDDLENGSNCFRQVIDYYHQAKDAKREGATWRRWGDCITASHKIEKIDCYEHALSLITNDKNLELTTILIQLGTKCFDEGDLKNGAACFKEVAAIYHRAANKANEEIVLVSLGSNYPFGLAVARADYFQRAITLLRQRKVRDYKEEASVLKYLAEAHLADGKLNTAEAELQELLLTFKALGDKKTQRIYDLLATAYRMGGDPAKSLSYAVTAVNTMVASKDTTDEQFYYFELAGAYYFIGSYDKSIVILNQVLNDPSHEESYYYIHALSLSTKCMLKEGKPTEALRLLILNSKVHRPHDLEQEIYLFESFGSCYRALKNYPQAEKYYLSMARASDSLSMASGVNLDVRCNFFISDLYVDMGNYKKAAFYLKKITSVPNGLFTSDQLGQLQLLRFKIDSAAGREVAAIKHYQHYKKFNDSIFNKVKNKQLQEFEIKYDTEKKQRAIAGLEIREKLQQAELQRINLQRNLTLAGIVLSLITAAMAYKNFRQKKRSNQLMQVHQKEIDQKNGLLQKVNFKQELLLIEKEWLLREIHHRVKNNLQTTISLLNMQSAYLFNKEARAAIEDSQRRMQAMSLIHQKLYQAENMDDIEMYSYISELVNYIKESFSGKRHIHFKLQISPVKLDIAQAVPLGLIINEAITNSIKYAFPDNNSNGEILIEFKRTADGQNLLTIADNGIGLPEDFDAGSQYGSLGMNLIRGLVGQIHGTFSIKSDKGTILNIIFKDYEITREDNLLEINEDTLAS
jgi:two-component system, sensor histidine kinase PdtaS